MPPTDARLSVIIPATSTTEDAGKAALAVRAQAGCALQILVPTAGLVGPEIDGVEWLPCPCDATLPRLLGAALSRAGAENIAVLDGAYGVGDGWVEATLSALDEHTVVGGAVEPADLVTATDWAAYFADYGRFMSPLPRGEAAELPGSNIAFRRCALQHGREFAGEEFWKTYWCRALQAEGYKLHAEPEMVVHYRKRFRLRWYLGHRFHSGRCFAGMRRGQISTLKRAIYVAGSPLLVGVFLYRTLEQVLPRRRHRAELARSMPVMLLAMLAWAAGEGIGYLCGPGASCSKL